MGDANGYESRSLIDLWLHQAGKTEVDKQFHFWCCLATVASVVADRVGFNKFAHKRLAPNIYLMLIGPSTSGKNQAIDIAESFLTKVKNVHYFRGKTTGQALIDTLAKRADQGSKATDPKFQQLAKITLATPELAMSVGTGGAANDFVKIMTELYSGGDSVIQERTRTSGYREIERPCINWIAGTTREWLCKTITSDDIQSGFFGRICAIVGKGRTERIIRPLYPPDQRECWEHMLERFRALAQLDGPFTMSPEAEAVEQEWYERRPEPDDEALLPFFGREHDLMLKLAMILALSERAALRLEVKHVAVAQELVNKLRSNLPEVIEYSMTTEETRGRNLVAGILKQHGHVQHSILLRMCSTRGINARSLKDAIDMLVQEKRVRVLSVSGARWYEWKASRVFKELMEPVITASSET